MSHRLARSLLALHLLALMVGTQMPGAWRSGVEHSVHAPLSLASWAHFFVFIGMTLLMSLRPLAWPAGRVVLTALALALLTEGLQFFAIERHPRWRDVGIDMAGTLLALGVVMLWQRFRHQRSSRQ